MCIDFYSLSALVGFWSSLFYEGPLGLAYVLLVETNHFSELVVTFTDYALRISLGTFSILPFIRRINYNFLNVCPFDCTSFVVSGMVWIPLNGLTSPVGCLLLFQLTVLSRSAIDVYLNILVTLFCVVTLRFCLPSA